jgi:replicative DNA helicase
LRAFFEDFPLYVSDTIDNINDLWAEAERAVNGPKQAKLLIVDYIQLLSASSRKHRKAEATTKRVEEVTYISKELKAMARELDIPVLAISSLNREVVTFAARDPKKRTVIRPEIYHLRETGQLEYDAEAIFLLHNPDIYAGMSEDDRKLLHDIPVWNIICDVAAQRNGPTGDVPLKFVRERMEMMTLDEYELSLGRAVAARPSTPEPDFGDNRKALDEIEF